MFNRFRQFFNNGENNSSNSLVGKVLKERYQITANLDAGGMGETYLAIDLDIPSSPKPKCVIKRIQPHLKNNPEIIRLFKQEAQILYNLGLGHEQIPILQAYFIYQQDFYLVQDFIDGENLTKSIGEKKWTEAEVIQLLKEILSVLAYVHDQKVIHRDIKPANLMRRYRDGKLILIDFGCVKEVKNTVITGSGKTILTVQVGTDGYMPSEQALGKPNFSSDLYAVGITGIQALTGLIPQKLPQARNEIVWRDFTQVGDELAEFLSKMVRFNCYERYEDAKEALQVLEEVDLKVNTVFEHNYVNQDNKSASYYFALGYMLLWDQNKLEEAKNAFEKALQLNPNDTAYYYNLGIVLYNQNKLEEAKNAFEKAIQLDPDFVIAKDNLEILMKKINNPNN